MLVQFYMVVALNVLSSSLFAARIQSKAKFVPTHVHPVPALRLHHTPPDGSGLTAEMPLNQTSQGMVDPEQPVWDMEHGLWQSYEEKAALEADQDYQKKASEALALYAQEKAKEVTTKALTEYDSVMEALVGEAKQVQKILVQPGRPWGLNQCLGKDAVVPQRKYHNSGATSTPNGAFKVLDRDEGDLMLSTPWRLTDFIRATVERGIDERRQVVDGKVQPQEWAPMMRGECCGLDAELFVENVDGDILAKVRCLGAEEGWRCRLDAEIVALEMVPPSACAAGFKCQETPTSVFGDGTGVCLPVPT